MTKTRNFTPALQFKDELGNSYPFWGEKKFSCIARKINDGYKPKNSVESFECIELESLRSETGLLIRTFRSGGQKSMKTKFLTGDVLFGKLRPYLKKFYLADFDGVCTSEIWVLRPKSVPSEFLFYVVQSHHFNRVANIQSGSKMPRSDWGLVSQSIFKIPFDYQEQQKIASFLSSVDIKIEQLGKKKALLEQYKKGMIQKLFSQEFQFKDEHGNDFSGWKEKKLGELCKITTGKLDANAMVDGGQYRFYTCAREYYWIDKFAFDADALLISGNGVNVGYIHYYSGKFNAYQRTYVLDQFEENIFYIKFYLEQHLQKRINYEKKVGNTPYIVLNTLADMPLKTPCEKEQQKIANFLSAIDKKIELVAEQLEQARTFKKGLLQQMFI